MKLKPETIYRIDGYDLRNGGEIKKALCKLLGKSMHSIYLYLRENHDNGELTKLAALRLIAGKLDISNVESLVE